MLVSVFKKNYLNQYLLIFISSISLWIGTFLNPQPIATDSVTLLYGEVAKALNHFPLLASILAYLLLLVEGLFFNVVLAKHKLVTNASLMPMFVYVTLFSAMQVQTITPILISNLFILIALNNLLSCDNIKTCQDKIFRASAMISIAGMFDSLYLYFILLIPLVLIIYKIYYWREWVTVILGFILPQIALFLYYFFVDGLDVFLYSSMSEIFQINLSFDFSNKLFLIFDAVLILIFIVSFFHYMFNSLENVALYRKKTLIIVWLTLVDIIILMYMTVVPFPIQLFVIPFSFFISTYILRVKQKEFISDIVLLLVFVCSLLSVYMI